MQVDRRVSRRGVAWKPLRSQVIEAGRFVRAGLPIHERWLPFLPPRLRLRARLQPTDRCAPMCESEAAQPVSTVQVERAGVAVSTESLERSRQ